MAKSKAIVLLYVFSWHTIAWTLYTSCKKKTWKLNTNMQFHNAVHAEKRQKAPKPKQRLNWTPFFENCSEKLQQHFNILLWLKQKTYEYVSSCQSWCFHVSSKPFWTTTASFYVSMLSPKDCNISMTIKSTRVLWYISENLLAMFRADTLFQTVSLTSPLALSVTLHPLI